MNITGFHCKTSVGKVLSWVVQGKKRTIEDIKRLLAHRTTDFADVWLENLGRILIDMYGSKIRESKHISCPEPPWANRRNALAPWYENLHGHGLTLRNRGNQIDSQGERLRQQMHD